MKEGIYLILLQNRETAIGAVLESNLRDDKCTSNWLRTYISQENLLFWGFIWFVATISVFICVYN
jgi:hypothetical protein